MFKKIIKKLFKNNKKDFKVNHHDQEANEAVTLIDTTNEKLVNNEQININDNKNRKYTNNEIDILISLYLNYIDIDTICVKLNRTHSSISNKLNELKKTGQLPQVRHTPPAYKKWTKKDDELLKQYWLHNFTPTNIATILHTSTNSVNSRMRYLGLKKTLTYVRYTPEEIEILIDLYKKMLSYSEIANILNRDVRSIDNKIRSLIKNNIIENKRIKNV